MVARFAEEERALLLNQRGIGAGTLRRLEAAGYRSIEQLRHDGVAVVIERATVDLRDHAWANRAQALRSALRAAGASHDAQRPAASMPADALTIDHLVLAHDVSLWTGADS
jgi:hypothetical protein